MSISAWLLHLTYMYDLVVVSCFVGVELGSQLGSHLLGVEAPHAAAEVHTE